MADLLEKEVVVCRPTLQKDTDEVMELSSHIWEGGDYIPRVWNEWLAEPEGLLGVVEMSGRVVGIFKLTKFQDKEWYMEGLRVHPDMQGRGIAAHIHNYVVETWRRIGSGVIRLVTGSYNVKVHQMCERSGFKRIGEFIPYRATSLAEETENFAALRVEDSARAMEFVLGSPTHALSWCLINLGWVYGDMQLKHVREAAREGHAWWWKENRGFLSIWEDDEDDEHNPGIQLVGCHPEDLAEILMDYRRLAGKLGYKSPGWVAPRQPQAITSLEAAGFAVSWDLSLYIYELRA